VSQDPINRRRVHYISGFDPRGARFYHGIYSRESQLQAREKPLAVSVGARSRLTPRFSNWAVEGESESGGVRTDYEFLGWDDLVRQNWTDGPARLFGQSLPVYLNYLLRGGFRKVRRLSSSAFFSGALPPVYLLLLSCLAFFLFRAAFHWTADASGSAIFGGAVGLAAAFGLWRAGLRWAERLGLLWLLRTYGFLYRWRMGGIPEVDRRVEEMAERVLECALHDPVDETIVVGHSVGTVLAVLVLARVVEKLKARASLEMLSKIQLLTLGHCIPLVLFFPNAGSLKDALAVLAGRENLRWTDVSAKADPLCFFHTDPVSVAGVELPGGTRPRLTVARFFKMFPREVYRRMRFNKMRLHFQYLMASPIPSAYDYFAMTAGPGRLHEHLGGAECSREV
jgi:hypothetical protein